MSDGYDRGMASSIASSPVQVRCKGILFDMDGILISSLGSVERSWTKWANLRGVDPAYVLSVIHGRRAIESVAMLRPDLDPAEELKLIEDIELADGEGITVLPGVKELIAALPRDRWTVVTSATERLARMRLAGAGFIVPERLVTAETGERGQAQSRTVPGRSGAAGISRPRSAWCLRIRLRESRPDAPRTASWWRPRSRTKPNTWNAPITWCAT